MNNPSNFLLFAKELAKEAGAIHMKYFGNISSLENIGQVKVKLTFDPPWNKDMMSDDARLALGY